MYSPEYNRPEDRAEIVEFMRANNFALLVTAMGGELAGSHLPVTVEESGAQITLHMHMARNNPQWESFFDEDAMVVFFGAHAYVSPRWYEQKERVPTWNYAAVHAYGKPQVKSDRAAKHASQRALVELLDPKWLPEFDALRRQYVDQMLDAIVSFDIPVTRLEVRWKLSQNRGRREQERIVAELEKSADTAERALAALTRRHFVPE
jgi:transcriptional regulator